MSAGVWCASRSWAARCYGVALLLSWALAGCATAPVKQSPPSWNMGAPRLRPTSLPTSAQVLLAMSDGPPTGGEPSGPAVRGYSVPGRKPDSQVPYEFFLGNAAHRLVAFMYGVKYPSNRIFYNTETLQKILSEKDLGDTALLHSDERNLRPDITNISRRVLFEIKPWTEQGLQEGREEARIYLTALNRALLEGRRFMGGTDFHGEVLIRFARGQYIWRLEWRTQEPGVVQYRWTRSQQRFDSEAAAYEAGQWVELTEQELRQYGGWVAQAVEDMVRRREELATFSGAVGVVIEVAGNVATGFFSGAIFGQMGSSPGARQPPAQGGGQVIPFPSRPPPTAPPAQVPAAAGMSLPR
ncbi:hypothetical protein ATI61_109423 [Archangium gephyra]|uniref:Lipoprotein n=1 Tax=Archangium gephyra TaxID=48 RepID=A0ABX9JW14_9BACT|nr:hypothetical protein ATI61_109423 [Archangium gephyra]